MREDFLRALSFGLPSCGNSACLLSAAACCSSEKSLNSFILASKTFMSPPPILMRSSNKLLAIDGFRFSGLLDCKHKARLTRMFSLVVTKAQSRSSTIAKASLSITLPVSARASISPASHIMNTAARAL